MNGCHRARRHCGGALLFPFIALEGFLGGFSQDLWQTVWEGKLEQEILIKLENIFTNDFVNILEKVVYFGTMYQS